MNNDLSVELSWLCVVFSVTLFVKWWINEWLECWIESSWQNEDEESLRRLDESKKLSITVFFWKCPETEIC